MSPFPKKIHVPVYIQLQTLVPTKIWDGITRPQPPRTQHTRTFLGSFFLSFVFFVFVIVTVESVFVVFDYPQHRQHHVNEIGSKKKEESSNTNLAEFMTTVQNEGTSDMASPRTRSWRTTVPADPRSNTTDPYHSGYSFGREKHGNSGTNRTTFRSVSFIPTVVSLWMKQWNRKLVRERRWCSPTFRLVLPQNYHNYP